MKYAPGGPNIDGKLLRLLGGPSWLSGIVVGVLGVLFCLGIILSTRYQASSVRLDFLNYQAGQIAHLYQNVNNDLLSNTYLSNLPLLIFWGLVGIVVYLFATNMLAAVHGTAELTSELHYIHANRRTLLWSAVRRLIIRLAVLGTWFAYILFFLHHVVPYCIAASIVASAELQPLQSLEYAVLAVATMTLALHVHTLLLRLFLLRPRAFSQALYADIDESET